MSNDLPPDSVGQAIAGAAITTYREKLQKELARSPLASLGSSAVSTPGLTVGTAIAVAAPTVAVVAAAGALPYLASKLLGVGRGGSRLNGNTQGGGTPSVDPKRTEEHIVKIAKKAEFATIRAISERFKNVKFLNTKPTNEVTEAQRGGKRTETRPLTVTDPETFTRRVQNYCEQHGCSSEEAALVAKFSGAFSQSEMSEEFRVLSAAQNLRDEFHLTPKPSIRWGQRKQEGAEIVLEDVLKEHAPDLPFRQKTLADLSFQEWWEAFYEVDAQRGRISDKMIKDIDPGFRQGFCRSLGIGSLTSFTAPGNYDGRREHLGSILGSKDVDRIQGFMVAGRPRGSASRDIVQSA